MAGLCSSAAVQHPATGTLTRCVSRAGALPVFPWTVMHGRTAYPTARAPPAAVMCDEQHTPNHVFCRAGGV